MGYSKRQFISAALEEIGLADYAFDMQPQQLESALRRLDSMLAEWNGKGIRLGYPLPDSPEYSDINAETGVPDSANEAIITNLALRIAPSYGRAPMPGTQIAAKIALNVILSRAVAPPEMQFNDSIPMGAGHKYSASGSRIFMSDGVDQLTAGANDALEIPGIEDAITLEGGSVFTPTVTNITQQVTVVAPLTWIDHKERWDVEPTFFGTASLPVAGDVWKYVLGGVTRYRLIPDSYDPYHDAFYLTFEGGVCSDLVVRRPA